MVIRTTKGAPPFPTTEREAYANESVCNGCACEHAVVEGVGLVGAGWRRGVGLEELAEGG